jgi:hypothetical protein
MTLWLASLAGCEANSDTHWHRPDPPMDASSADADAPDADAQAASDAGAMVDASEFDSSAPLPLINCSAVMRDAGGDDGCVFDCFAACAAWCNEADGGCGDAAAWLSCARCSDGGPIVPTL